MFFAIKQNTRWEGAETGEGGTANETQLESARAMNKNLTILHKMFKKKRRKTMIFVHFLFEFTHP